MAAVDSVADVAGDGKPDWAALRTKLAGRLVLPDSPEYDATRQPFNLVYADRRPAAIALCTRPEDVQACLATARESGVPFAARSGGHSYAGYSAPERGLVADLGGMDGIQVRPDGTASIGPGARLADVYTALARAGRCLPAGSCPSVGIAGLTLGGGIGVLARKFGLTCDHVRTATVATVDGGLRAASEHSEPELFWALRGGGGGNFGVVTSFEFATVAAPPRLTVFSLAFPTGSAAAVFDAWQHWLPETPDELWSNCAISGGMTPSCRIGGCFVGPADALSPMLDALVKRAGVPATSRKAAPKSYLDAMRYFAGSSEKESFAGSSRILNRPVPDSGDLVGVVTGLRGTDLLFDGLGGAVSRVAPDATAFPHRQALGQRAGVCLRAIRETRGGGADSEPSAGGVGPAGRHWGLRQLP